MAVNLRISQQQASILVPLLQQISDDSYQPKINSSTSSPSSSMLPSTPSSGHNSLISLENQVLNSTDASESSCVYSCDELFQGKGRNSKSSPAHSYCHTIVREAAKAVGMWDSAPSLDNVSQSTLKKFRETAYELCPTLKRDPPKLKKLLGQCLMNRRAYLRKKKLKSPPQKRKKPNERYRSRASAKRLFPYSGETPCIKATEEFQPGASVVIKFGSVEIGRGMFMNKVDEMYGQVILLENHCIKKNIFDEVDLQKPVGEKVTFQELKKHDVFQWKLSKLSNILDGGQENVETAEDLPDFECDSESESSSEYENYRSKNVTHNLQAWNEIKQGNISLDGEGNLLYSKECSLKNSTPHSKETSKSPKKVAASSRTGSSFSSKTVSPPAEISKTASSSPKTKTKASKKAASTKLFCDERSKAIKKPVKKCTVLQKKSTSPTKKRKFWTYIDSDQDNNSGADVFKSPSELELASTGRGKRNRKKKVISDFT